MINLILIGLAAYLIGSIPFSIIVTRLITGQDVRKTGSGHAGATNTMRVAGWWAGVLVLLLDLGKGALAVWLADSFTGDAINLSIMRSTAVGLAVIGHCWPVVAKFRGGMGMATSGGALLYVWPLGFVIGVGLAAALQLIVRHSARGNVATGILITPLWALFGIGWERLAVALAVGFIVALRAASDWHREYRELWFDREL
jgi:glycerol-3-phosphate acyltransferase PlsY